MNTLKHIISEHYVYKKTIFKMAISELKKTYKDAALGWLWAVLRPMITLFVYYFAFTVGIKVDKEVAGIPYVFWLISGFVPWFYMRDIIVSGAGSIKKYKFLVTQIKYPISTIPTFVSLSNIIVNLVLMLIMMGIFTYSGYGPTIYWVQIPILFCLMFVFFTTWSLFASLFTILSNDIYQLIKSSTILIFWLSGIMYDVNNIENELIRQFMYLNPINFFVNGFRNSLVYNKWIFVDMLEIESFTFVYLILLLIALSTYKRLNKEIADII